MKGQVLTISATRGGSGKTSTADTLGHIAAEDGLKVLLLDMDSQSSLTAWEDADPDAPGLYEVLASGLPMGQAIQKAGEVDIIPASADLMALQPKADSLKQLGQALDSVKNGYNIVIIDTPPNFGQLQNMALFAANRIILAQTADADGLQSLYNLADIYNHVKQLGSKARPLGCIITKFDRRPKIKRIYLDTMKEQGDRLGFPVLGTIRQCIAMEEARAIAEPLTQYAPKCTALADYEEVWRAIYKEGKLE